METLTFDDFNEWMETYGRASKENNPEASANLFAQDARYYETPFSEPITGREAIHQYWLKGSQTLKDKSSTYEIIAIHDSLGIARWQSKFTSVKSGKRLELDCLFLVECNEDGRCKLFREWWHLQEI